MWQQWVTINFILQLIYCDSKNIYYGTKYLFKISDEKNKWNNMHNVFQKCSKLA